MNLSIFIMFLLRMVRGANSGCYIIFMFERDEMKLGELHGVGPYRELEGVLLWKI